MRLAVLLEVISNKSLHFINCINQVSLNIYTFIKSKYTEVNKLTEIKQVEPDIAV